MQPTESRRKRQVIIDTSVWIDYFNGSLSPSHLEAIQLLLEGGEVAITDVIHHELLVGTNSTKEYNLLDEMLKALDQVFISNDLKNKFNQFGFDLKKQGLLGKYTDATLAFLCKEYHLPIFSYDKWFEKLAEKKIIHLFSLTSSPSKTVLD